MITELLKQKIEKKFGKRIKFQKDCKALSAAVEKHCNEKISFITIQRVFGIIPTATKPSEYTVDLLARYAGLEDWKSAIGKSKNTLNSYFENTDLIISANLEIGQIINLTYSPDRELKLQYEDNMMYRVIYVSNGKLMQGDMLHILRLELNFPLVCEYVIRNETNLGKFIGGEGDGIILLSLEP